MDLGAKVIMQDDHTWVDPIRGLWIGGDYINPEQLTVGEIINVSPNQNVLIYNGLYSYGFDDVKTLEIYDVEEETKYNG